MKLRNQNIEVLFRATVKMNHDLIGIVYSRTVKNAQSNWLSFLFLFLTPILLLKFAALMLIPEIDLFSYYSVTTSLKIVGITSYLTLVGYSVSLLFSPWYFKFKSHLFHSLLIAQVFLTLYFLFRSFTNFILENININIVRISYIDFIFIAVLLFVIALINNKKNNHALKLSSHINLYLNHLKSGLFLLYIFFLFIVFVSASETPRLSPLSTDPNIHAYFTNLISRFGTGLYEFKENGVQLQRYPSGFSYLNYIWSELTGIDALNTVTIQTTLQLFIAAFIVCELVLRKKSTNIVNILILPLSLIFIILFFLPYGYQPSNFHLEGTARTSLLSAYAFLMSFVIIFYSSKEKINQKSTANSLSELILIIITYLFVFITNPINTAVYLIMMVGNSLIRKRGFVITVILLTASSLVLVTDPFLMSGLRSILNPVDNTSFIISNSSGLGHNEINLEQLGSSTLLDVSSNFQEIINFDSITSKESVFLLIIICIGYSVYVIVINPKTIIFKAYLLQFVILFLGYCFLTILISVSQINSLFSAGYLLQSYFNFSVIQLMYILLLIGTSLIIYDTLNRKKYLFLIMTVLVITAISYFDKPASISARVLNPGSIGTVTKNDLEVLKFIEKHYKEFSNGSNNYNDYSNAPKTLLFPTAINAGTEKWLFPIGASSVYPLYNTYPPVFFYGNGSDKYTQEIYNNILSQRIDISILDDLGVKYAFVPEFSIEENYLTLYARENSVVLKQVGSSLFLELN